MRSCCCTDSTPGLTGDAVAPGQVIETHQLSVRMQHVFKTVLHDAHLSATAEMSSCGWDGWTLYLARISDSQLLCHMAGMTTPLQATGRETQDHITKANYIQMAYVTKAEFVFSPFARRHSFLQCR